jgi:ferritin-like metal-binding protein YciE
MAIKNPKELFVWLLSDVRQREERMTKIYQELSRAVEDPDIKEALESRAFVQKQTLSTLDQCFNLIGEKPVTVNDRLHDVFMEDFRREVSEIQLPLAKALYVVARAHQLVHLHMGEYVAMIAMADITEHYGVGTLLESCLADKRAFVERTRRRVRNIIESKIAAGVA